MAFDSAAFDVSAFDEAAFLFEEDVELVAVPDVVGDSQATGTATLQGDGFNVRVVGVYSAIVAAGTIVSQDPAASTEVPSGSQVTINVSLGEAPDVDQYARAKMMLIMLKRRRIKQREADNNEG